MGTVRERRPGVWEVRVYLGRDPVTNRPRQKSEVIDAGPRTKKGNPPTAVMDKLHRMEAEAAAGKFGGTTGTVALLLDRYMDHVEHRGHSVLTLRQYRRMARLYIVPALGSKKVGRLTAWDLDAFYTGMTAAEKKPNTIRQVHVVLSGALAQAVKWGWCPSNVARMASPPSVRTPRIVPPTAAEVRQILDAAEKRNPTLAAMLMLAALTGARRGELCGLRWADVDLSTGTLRIARSVVDLPGRAQEKPTKSYQERTLALGEAGVNLLQIHRNEVLETARSAEVTLAEDAFIFSERLDGATPIRPDGVTHFFGRVRDELGLRHVHLHSLRHFAATQLAARGDVSVRTIAGRLGHADASLTMRVYAAFFPASDVGAAEVVGRALQPRDDHPE